MLFNFDLYTVYAKRALNNRPQPQKSILIYFELDPLSNTSVGPFNLGADTDQTIHDQGQISMEWGRGKF